MTSPLRAIELTVPSTYGMDPRGAFGMNTLSAIRAKASESRTTNLLPLDNFDQ